MIDWRQFEKESTENLIQYIKWKDQPEYIEASQGAFIAFTFRFRADLIKKCEVICSKWGYDTDFVIELAKRTFNKFWLTPLYDHSERKTARTCDEGIKFYLYAIANHELVNIHREKCDPNPYTGDETIISDFPEDLGDSIPERKKELKERMEIVDMALSRLSPKHKIIYLTYLVHSKKGKHLPAHLLKEMRETLGLAQHTIRFYNYEATTKVNDYLRIWEKKNS
jgi:hypothetical protein